MARAAFGASPFPAPTDRRTSSIRFTLNSRWPPLNSASQATIFSFSTSYRRAQYAIGSRGCRAMNRSTSSSSSVKWDDRTFI